MHETGLDLDAYLARIGLPRPTGSAQDVLRAIVAHHTAAIPFESIDAFLGRGIAIDTDSLTDKLIHRRRGGYCFEQNLLLLAALRQRGMTPPQQQRLQTLIAALRGATPGFLLPDSARRS